MHIKIVVPVKTRQWAYAILAGVSIEEALTTNVEKVRVFLAKETGYSADTFRPFTPLKELSAPIIMAVEFAKCKGDLAIAEELLRKSATGTKHMGLRVDIVKFLKREDKQDENK